ncbi:ATP-binding protein [Klebsiella aerogenes]|uniref:ATP-binding protein n=1 Tax=Klebsiella aerogenes TaxID=548 RepID=UPI000B40C96A|nr:ATP-binding protein [Klebsiella aerogenes]MEB7636646.1 ATP-binding protein [Klebsiella aerogenes]RNT33780.1 ATP-binding protein [Klebsiella aerogenes]HDS4946568.1 ATP-binding protein [Klebsiella aerogenes]
MKFKPVEELKIGHVVEVTGTKIRVELSNNVEELTRSYCGKVYAIGQLGSIVKINFGRNIIFGFVTLLRMRSDELQPNSLPIPPEADQRIMEVELFSHGYWSPSNQKLTFNRGVKIYPLPQQGVYLLTHSESAELFSAAEGARDDSCNPLVPFAHYSSANSIPCRANIDKLFGLHCAVLGSTGSGKSGAVATILHSILEHSSIEGKTLSPRIVMIDPHDEYGLAFKDRGITYQAYSALENDESKKNIKLPYWLMSSDEFRTLIIGKTEKEATSQNNIIYKALSHARMVTCGITNRAPDNYNWPLPTDDQALDEPRPTEGHSIEEILSFDSDKPIPFCLNEFENHIRYIQAARIKSGKIEKETESTFAEKFKSILDKLSVLRRDPRIKFMMENWSQKNDYNLEQILDQLVGEVIIEEKHKDIRIIDISGLPNEVAGPLAATLARLLFQYKVHQTVSERNKDPFLLVCEEAHRYVPNHGEAQYAAAQSAIRRIAREGRKYGLGLMLISQRPADIESTVISQCGSWVVLRLTNATDQQHVSTFLPDGLSGLVASLPSLSQQEGIFVGEAAALPSRIKINFLPEDRRPRSENVSFSKGWSEPRFTVEQLKGIADRMSGQVKISDNVQVNIQADDLPF